MTTSLASLRVREKRVAKVLQIISTTPTSTLDLARKIGVSESTAYLLLSEMKAVDQIHLTRGGRKCRWAPGPAPGRAARIAEFQFDRPVRTTWPMHNYRDELVSALFGPARGVAHG